ncbi:MAG: peptide deformylase [Deltaproteobacteria bacterium]|nr:peptide deformylase [Deltaproteobacteria bacterium]
MAELKILTYPDPFLMKKAVTASEAELGSEQLKTLLSDMIETMRSASGIGLAAPQVGVGVRAIVLDVPIDVEDSEGEVRQKYGTNILKLVNPTIEASSGTTKFEEGCLSVPGVKAEVKRAEKVTLKAFDENGNAVSFDADGLLAIALQHEIDHLDGVLFIDRLGRIKRDLIKRKLRKALSEEEHGAVL